MVQLTIDGRSIETDPSKMVIEAAAEQQVVFLVGVEGVALHADAVVDRCDVIQIRFEGALGVRYGHEGLLFISLQHGVPRAHPRRAMQRADQRARNPDQR